MRAEEALSDCSAPPGMQLACCLAAVKFGTSSGGRVGVGEGGSGTLRGAGMEEVDRCVALVLDEAEGVK